MVQGPTILWCIEIVSAALCALVWFFAYNHLVPNQSLPVIRSTSFSFERMKLNKINFIVTWRYYEKYIVLYVKICDQAVIYVYKFWLLMRCK
jgi:hypothetical protein